MNRGCFATTSKKVDWISGSVPFYDYIHIPFIILFGLSIVATWARPRIGYIMGLTSGVAGIAVLSPFTFVKGVSSPANFGLFFYYVITIFPMMLAAVLYSLMAYLDLRNPNRPISSNRMYLRRLIIILILGFMIGGVTVGSFAAGTENQLLSSNSSADITIPRGATVQGNIAYSPGNFTVKAGKTVTWVNKDITVHTVTSSSGMFDSRNLNPGQTWSHDFTQSGLYEYYCTLHAWMKGNVTVTP